MALMPLKVSMTSTLCGYRPYMTEAGERKVQRL